MPPQLLETVEDQKEALRDIVRERLRLEEKQRLRDIVAAQRPRLAVPSEFTPEQRVEKAAATTQRVIEKRAQFVRPDAVRDLMNLEPKFRSKEFSFSDLRKVVAERQLFPKKPGFFRSFFTIGERRAETLLAGILGFGLEAIGKKGPTSEALLHRATILAQETRREMDEAGLGGQLGSIAVDLAEFAVDIAATRGVGRLVPKKTIAKKVTKAAIKRGASKRTAKQMGLLAKRTPEEAARFAAATALNAGLNTFAVTGNLTETTRNALVGAAIGGALGGVLGAIPALGGIAKSVRSASAPRRALGLPKTGQLTREQVKNAAIATIKRQQAANAPVADIIQTAKTAEALVKAEKIGPLEAVRPRGDVPLRPTPASTKKEIPRERTQEGREAPHEPEFFPEATAEARFRPPKAARPPQEKVGPGAAPPIKGRPAVPPLLRPARGTPRDPSTASNAKGLEVAVRSLEADAAKSPAQQIAKTTGFWHGIGRARAGPVDPASIPIWAKVKGLRPVRKARVFFKRQQFVRFQETKTIFDAEVPIARALLGKLTGKLEKAKPLRGRMEGLKAKERRRRSRIMSFIQEKVRGEKGAMQAAAQLRGAYPSVGFRPIGKFFNQAERNRIFDHINTHRSLDGRSFAKARLTLVMRAILEDGHLPTRGELAELELIFGPRFARALIKKGDAWSRLKPNITQFLGIPRVLNTMWDLSATGRQGFATLVTSPIVSARSFVAQLKAFGSERYAVAFDRNLRRGPAARLREEAGLELTAITGEFSRLGEREEIFMSNIVQKMGRLKLKGPGRVLLPVKVLGMSARASERAFVTYLNSIRATLFDLQAAMLKRDGHLPTNPDSFKHYQALARLINTSTGRGNAKFLQGEFWNNTFFSPRFMTARFEHIPRATWDSLRPGAPWALRQIALRQLVGMASAWYTMAVLIGTAAEAFGWDIEMELDPRSSDFLKLRVGKTRIDMGAGYGQVIRVVVQLALREELDPLTQKVSKISVGSKIITFLRYKLAPVPGAIFSVAEGETPSRDPANFPFIFEQLGTPIVAQNLREVVNEHGARGLILLVPEVLGVGVQVQDRDIDVPKIQNIAFQVTAIKATRKDALNLVKGVLSRGTTPAQLRAALRAEAIEQATSRARRRKKPATAASVRAAVSRALKSDSFKTRQKRLESLLRASQ